MLSDYRCPDNKRIDELEIKMQQMEAYNQKTIKKIKEDKQTTIKKMEQNKQNMRKKMQQMEEDKQDTRQNMREIQAEEQKIRQKMETNIREMQAEEQQTRKILLQMQGDIRKMQKDQDNVKYMNIMCDNITKVYHKIVDEIRTHQGFENFNCESYDLDYTYFNCSYHFIGRRLMSQAKEDRNIDRLIKSAYRNLGFDDQEWQDLIDFKNLRNTEQHPDVNVEEAFFILNNNFSDVRPSLKSALKKTLEINKK